MKNSLTRTVALTVLAILAFAANSVLARLALASDGIDARFAISAATIGGVALAILARHSIKTA